MRASIIKLLAPWLCLCASATGLFAAQSDPFAAGQRWSHAPDPAQPWIPRDMVFVGGGEFLWVAPAQQTPGLQLFSSDPLGGALSPAQPLFEDTQLGSLSGPIHVAAGDDTSELFAAHQVPVPGGNLRRAQVSRYDAQASARGATFQPQWTSVLAQPGNGPCALAATPDGTRVLLAAFDVNRGLVQLRLLEGSAGSVLLDQNVTASGLGHVGISADGQRLLLETGSGFSVLDADGQELFRRQAPQLSSKARFSGDGKQLAVGGVGALELLSDSGQGYLLIRRWNRGNNETCAALALSADGSTLACGWWDFTNGLDVRVEVLDANQGQILNSLTQTGSSSGLQNYPAALQLSATGERIAVGLWGTGDTRPEAFLLGRSQLQAILSADLEGSVYALALDASGTRLGVGLKDTHANLASATGRVALFDSGERDAQLVQAVRLGGQLEARFLPESASAVRLLLGQPRAQPLNLKQGLLWIDLSQPYLLIGAQAEGDGSYRGCLSVPLDSTLVGITFGVQGIALGAPGVRLSQWVAPLEVL